MSDEASGVIVDKGLPFPTREATVDDIAEARQILGGLSWGRSVEPASAREKVRRAYYLLGGDAYINAEVEPDPA
jgi:hypothetical protein